MVGVCAEHEFSVQRIQQKANSPKHAGVSLQSNLSMLIFAVSYLLMFSYLQKESNKAHVSAGISAQEMGYPRSLDLTPCFLLSL